MCVNASRCDCASCALDDSLDQVYPVVDGGPVEERHVLLVGLPDVEACLHQLPAALEDSVPANRQGVEAVHKGS